MVGMKVASLRTRHPLGRVLAALQAQDLSSLFRSIRKVFLFSAISFQAHGSVLMAQLLDGSKFAPNCE